MGVVQYGGTWWTYAGGPMLVFGAGTKLVQGRMVYRGLDLLVYGGSRCMYHCMVALALYGAPALYGALVIPVYGGLSHHVFYSPPLAMLRVDISLPWCPLVQYSSAWCAVVWYGMVLHGIVLHGVAWCCTVLHGKANWQCKTWW